jgi:hypothetical protein
MIHSIDYIFHVSIVAHVVESGIKHHIMVNLNTWAPYIFCQQYNLSSNQCNFDHDHDEPLNLYL